MLDINITKSGDKATIKLIGRLDTNSSPSLEEKLNSLYTSQTIIFDLEELEYVSSSGLRLFLLSKKRVKDTRIINVSDYVMEIFEATGFTLVMDIKKNEI